MSMGPKCTCSLLEGPAEDCPMHGRAAWVEQETAKIPVPQAGAYTVRTTHIQSLIRNGQALAEIADGQKATMRIEDMLEKAAADLRHAAEELTAERLACKGYPQI